MGDLILLLILILIIFIVIFKTYKPHIDIIQIETNRYKILMWYNHFEGPEIKRKQVKLCEYGKR